MNLTTYRTVPSTVVPLLLGAIVACSSVTDPHALPATVETTRIFTLLPPPAVTAVPDTLRITGAIGLNEPCYRFSASAFQRDTVVVILIAQRRPGICTQNLAAFSYTITVTGAQPGTFPFRLIHELRAEFSVQETALEQTVQLP